MVHGLADVVEQPGPLGRVHVHAQFGGHQAGQMSHFRGMLQHILPVAGPVFQPAQQLDQFRMDAMDTHLEGGLFPGFLNLLIQFLLGFFHHFLDPGRMDPAVVDQLLQGDPGHFPAHRVEAGNDHRFRRIVDDQVDTGQGLQGPDVPAFPADDPALHFIVGQGHYRNRGFRHLIRRTPLDGQGDDFPGLLVRGILGFLFHSLISGLCHV